MFKIIGADQKEYGPVTADQINAWILEGRANGQTLAQPMGSAEWKPLSGLSEFATALGVKSPAGGPPSFVEIKDPSALANAVLARNIPIEMGQCLRQGWKALLQNPGLFFGAAVLVVTMRLALAMIPFAGGLADWILYGALYGGFYLIFLKRLRGQPAGLGELFTGFSRNFPQLMLVGIVSRLLFGVGLVCCLILPGIYLAVAWKFSVPLVMDKGLEFWPAMETSRRVINRYWFQIFGMLVIAFLPYGLFIGYGMFRMFEPVTRIVSAVLSGQFDFSQLSSLTAGFLPLFLGQQLLMLVSLPFATAALMHAYETLFGARSTASA